MVRSENNGASDKRKRIIDAACDLIARKGPEATRTSEIAKGAGVAAGTVYLYFESKEDLIHVICQELMSEVTDTVMLRYSVEAPIRERFFAYWSALFHYLLEHPKQARLLLYLTASPYVGQDFKEKIGERMIRTRSEIVEDGKVDRVTKDVSSVVTSGFIYGSMLFMANDEQVRNEFVTGKVAMNDVINMWWDGVRQKDSYLPSTREAADTKDCDKNATGAGGSGRPKRRQVGESGVRV